MRGLLVLVASTTARFFAPAPPVVAEPTNAVGIALRPAAQRPLVHLVQEESPADHAGPPTGNPLAAPVSHPDGEEVVPDAVEEEEETEEVGEGAHGEKSDPWVLRRTARLPRDGFIGGRVTLDTGLQRGTPLALSRNVLLSPPPSP